jgi:two-component sensor histidine kinase
VALGDERALLTIRDNGTGFDLSQKFTGMGQRLIRGLVSQLGGSGHYEIDGGTAYLLEFSAGFDETPAL